MPACSSCGTTVAAGTAYCPSCGAAITSGSRGGGNSQLKFDVSALSPMDRIVGVATLVLFISFFLPWFSINTGSILGSISVDGLTSHGWLYIPMLTSIVLTLYFLIKAFGMGTLHVPRGMTIEQFLLIATGLNLVFVLLGFLLKPGGYGGWGWSFGAIVALAAAVVAFLPLGRPFIQAQRRR